MTHDRRMTHLAAFYDAADQVRSQVGRDGLDLGQLWDRQAPARTTASLRMSAQFSPAFASTSMPGSRS